MGFHYESRYMYYVYILIRGFHIWYVIIVNNNNNSKSTNTALVTHFKHNITFFDMNKIQRIIIVILSIINNVPIFL